MKKRAKHSFATPLICVFAVAVFAVYVTQFYSAVSGFEAAKTASIQEVLTKSKVHKACADTGVAFVSLDCNTVRNSTAKANLITSAIDTALINATLTFPLTENTMRFALTHWESYGLWALFTSVSLLAAWIAAWHMVLQPWLIMYREAAFLAKIGGVSSTNTQFEYLTTRPTANYEA